MAQIDNLTLDVRENGVFLTFVTGDGAAAAVSIDQLAEQHEGNARQVLLGWCQDRRSQTTTEGTNRLLVQDYAD